MNLHGAEITWHEKKNPRAKYTLDRGMVTFSALSHLLCESLTLQKSLCTAATIKTTMSTATTTTIVTTTITAIIISTISAIPTSSTTPAEGVTPGRSLPFGQALPLTSPSLPESFLPPSHLPISFLPSCPPALPLGEGMCKHNCTALLFSKKGLLIVCHLLYK